MKHEVHDSGVHNGGSEIFALFSVSGADKCQFADFACGMISAGGYVARM
jgi:hypothetical protein